MYPSSPIRSAAVPPAQLSPRPQARARSSAHPQRQPQQPQPPQQLPATESDITEVFDPDFKYIYNVSTNAVVHLPPARLNITRLVLCRNYRPCDPRSCAMGGNCKFVHADCDYAKLEAHPIHVNYIWRHESLCTYPRLPPGEKLTVWAPNNKQPATLIPSERILVTKGSQAYMICLQSVRSGLASPEELEHTAPLSHCAHYYFNRMCNRGERCNFIHAVHVDPNVQGDFKRAPGRGQHHPTPPSDKAGDSNARSGRERNTRSGGYHHHRGGSSAAEASSSSSRTIPPGSVRNASSSDKQTPTTATVVSTPRIVAEDNEENSVNSSSRARRCGRSSEWRRDLYARMKFAACGATSPYANRIHSSQTPEAEGREEGDLNASPAGGARSSAAARTDYVPRVGAEARAGATSPPLSTSTALPSTDTPRRPSDRPLHETQDEPLQPRGAAQYAGAPANSCLASGQMAERTVVPALQPFCSLSACSGSPQTQSFSSPEVYSQARGGSFSPMQFSWLAPSDSGSSHFSRSPLQHAQSHPPNQQQQQQQYPALRISQPLPTFSHYPLPVSLPSHDFASLNDSDVLNASHMGDSESAHTVNVIPRTRRRRGAVVSMGAPALHNSTPCLTTVACFSAPSFFHSARAAADVEEDLGRSLQQDGAMPTTEP
ncbi:hypothetical protein ABB37_06222 [Leptomonas pyrrhocoris]|uniref:C3H1-type domain-containing protein n=1 Tax=Leptomonas pyrrhocoris TaxID=157538 RepID=A0A0N0DUB2_LEPPY|nr:hypothetical protein ABB37_06222 [Leptomonas pyrrhocoris]KPA78622.1 hypothetical protein ABB37_06222 [Leptomonas pyrrhocoris]|eukprot:XP_015657061.1 hypothetical protein ABB37_06222 [Leptomonas pyrrhocoris]